MRHRIYLHIVWTTLDRHPSLDRRAAAFLAALLARVAGEERAIVHRLGIVQTHVHVLVRVHPKTDLPRLVQRFKGSSATIGRKQGHMEVRWASGYSIESVSVRALPQVSQYIATQHLHHPSEAIEGWPPSLGA
jgi:putative transposase